MADSRIGLTIETVSLTQILHDLTECVTTSRTKVAKRLIRLKVVCYLAGIDYESYIKLHKIQEEDFLDITAEEILALTNVLQDITYDRVVLNGVLNDAPKKAIEAALTSAINKDLHVYFVMCNLTCKLVKRLQRHTVFGPLYSSRDLIFLHKGGIAQRISLLHSFPQHAKEIKKAFGLGGDNDCTVILNPSLPQYDQVRTLLVGFIQHFMEEHLYQVSCGTIDTRAKLVKSISVAGLTLPVSKCERQSYNIRLDGVTSIMDSSVSRTGVFMSVNDTLEFNDEIGRTAHFTLLRYKKSFNVGSNTFGAELLDITIPYPNDVKSASDWYHYKSGNYTCKVNI
jgi:hypothetical protein